MKVGVIGTGGMGKNHVRVYSQLEGVKLAAVSDIDLKAAEEATKNIECAIYDDYKKMLDAEKLDAVSVVVPTSLHAKVAIDAINAGVNTLVEKPISNTLESAEKIIEAAKKNNVKLTVGHIERFNPAVQKLKEMVEQNYFGNIISLVARRIGIFPPIIKDTNVVIDLAVHDIDVFSFLTGLQPKKVTSIMQKTLNSEVEDSSNILLEYEGKRGPISGFIQANWVTPTKIRKLSITGTRGHAELDYILQSITYWSNAGLSEYKDFAEFISKTTSFPKKEIEVKREEPLRLELKHFVSCIANDTATLVRPEDAVAALRIALQALDYKQK